MNNLNPEGNIMPIDDDTAQDIKRAFIWAVSIFVVFLLALYILGKVYPPAETGIRTVPLERQQLNWYGDSIIIHFQELDSTEELEKPYTDTLRLWNTVDTVWLDSVGILERFPDYYKIPEFEPKPEIIYPEPEPKIIKIQRRIKNARSTRV